MISIKELKEEVRPYKDTLVLNGFFKVVKLLDAVIDEDDGELCYVYQNVHGSIVNTSCLIDWMPLKGHISDEDYGVLLHRWNLNTSKVWEIID